VDFIVAFLVENLNGSPIGTRNKLNWELWELHKRDPLALSTKEEWKIFAK